MNFKLCKRALFASTLSLLCAMASGSAAYADGDDAGVFGSITVTKFARDAIKASERGDWAQALSKFSQAIDQSKNIPELYYGQYKAAAATGDWRVACSALENLFSAAPSEKTHLSVEYGQALTMTGRYEEAVPVLKSALNVVDSDAGYLESKFRALVLMTRQPAPAKDIPMPVPVPRSEDQPPPPRVSVPVTDVDMNSKYALSYETAYRSEFIGICTYQGFTPANNITYYHPPVAQFHIEQTLKGPPLNHEIPVRFEFSDRTTDSKMPDGWHFDAGQMPKVGSRWLIFLENAVPVEGAFVTYHGSYGRQEATEANLNNIYAIIEAHRGQQ